MRRLNYYPLADVPFPLVFSLNYPFYFQIQVTERCNLRCKHCYVETKAVDMDFSLFVEAIDNFRELLDLLRVRGTVYLSGGEPLLWPWIWDAIRLVRRKKIVPRILTNGTLITPSIAKKIKKMGVKYVQVSLDGLRENHEYIRGKGTFRLAVMGIKNLVRAGIEVTVMVTLTKRNIGDIEALVKLAEILGVKRISFQRLVPIGHGEELRNLMLSSKEIANIMKRLLRIETKVNIVKREPFWGIIYKIPGGCSAGHIGFALLPDGTILPCRRLPIPLGNIKENSLIEIYFDHPIMKQLRNRNLSECSKCEYVMYCYGCRGIVYALTGKLSGRDPQCPKDFLAHH